MMNLGDPEFEQLALALYSGINIAREKHPRFAEGKYEALGVISQEVEEFTEAVERESDKRSIEEALDVMVTCARYIAGDHLPVEDRGFGWWKTS